jgi:hypothetical protein
LAPRARRPSSASTGSTTPPPRPRPPPPPALASAPAPAPESPPDPGSTRRWLGVGVGGVGVVGVALGAVFGLRAKSKLNQSNDGPCDASDTCDAGGLALRHDASGAATLSTVFFAVGGVALAGGVVLYLTAPRSAPTVGLVVAPAPGGASALLRTTF